MGTWKRLADMPESQSMGNGVIIGEKLYILGGANPPVGGMTDKCWQYDLKSNQWEPMADLPEICAWNYCCVYSGEIHLFSGLVSQQRSHFIYNIQSDTWRDGVSHTRQGSGLYLFERVGDKIYGFLEGTAENPIVVYDFQTETWKTEGESLNLHSYAMAAVGETIYAFGGYPVNMSTFPYNKDVYAYNTATKSWSVVSQMPECRFYQVCAVIDNLIYCIGGHKEDRSHPQTMFVFDTNTNTWEIKDGPPLDMRLPFTVVHKGKIYLAGGHSTPDGFEFFNHLYVYDPNGDEETDPPGPNPQPNPDPNCCDCGCAKVNINVTGCGRNQLIKDIAGVIQQSGCDCEITCGDDPCKPC